MSAVMVTAVSGEQVELAEDFGAQAQRAAETHLEACWTSFRAEDYEDVETLPPSPSVGPFDGCQTCEVREMLHAALPFLQAGFARDNEAPRVAYTVTLNSCPVIEIDLPTGVPTDG